jgi:hypothetical protein
VRVIAGIFSSIANNSRSGAGQPAALGSRAAGLRAGSAVWVRASGGEGEKGIGAAGSGRRCG